jgi:hypothetical protein
MTKTIEELEKTIKNHEAIIHSYRTQLNEVNLTKKWWLKSMKACTTPFAMYNKNINSYLSDPELHNLAKDTLKLQDICLKIQKTHHTLKTENKVIKAELKLFKLEQKVLANPAYISQRYNDLMNVKETLEEVLRTKELITGIKDLFKLQVITQMGFSDSSEIILDSVLNPTQD